MKNLAIQYDRIEKGESPQDFLNNIHYTDNLYASLSVKKWRLLCGRERENITKIENCGETIGSLFNICVGIATLKDEVYFFTPISQDEDYYYTSKDNQIFAIEKALTRSVVKISDVKSSEDLINNKRRIIFPYVSSKDGKAIAIQEETMASEYPKCYEYFYMSRKFSEDVEKGSMSILLFMLMEELKD